MDDFFLQKKEEMSKLKEREYRFIDRTIPFYRKKTSCGNYFLPLWEEI